jgi:AcrR family transcriptional regulator
VDAAEALFASRGFYGVSIRDITGRAGVQLALVSYHFGSKQKLFREVVRRRGVVHAAGMQGCLDEMLARRKGKATVDDIIETFCTSIFERLLSEDSGWPSYIQLLARSANTSQEERFVAAMNELFDPVLKSYVRAIAQALPELTRANLFAAFYFLQGGLIYMTANTGGIDRLSEAALCSSDFRKLLPRAVRFFAAGFRALQEGQRPATRRRSALLTVRADCF